MKYIATCACDCRCGTQVPDGQVMCSACANGRCPTKMSAPTAWVQEDRYNASQTKVYTSRPDGRLGWNTEKVALFGALEAKHAYVVKVIYSTGSSFGHENGLVAVAAVASTAETAIEIKNAIAANAALPRPSYEIVVADRAISCDTWTGYFESVEAVLIEFVEVMDLP